MSMEADVTMRHIEEDIRNAKLMEKEEAMDALVSRCLEDYEREKLEQEGMVVAKKPCDGLKPDQTLIFVGAAIQDLTMLER